MSPPSDESSPAAPEGALTEAPTVRGAPSGDRFALMLQAAAQGMPIDALRELRSMVREDEADEARRAFYRALAQAKAEFGPVLKKNLVDYPQRDRDGRGSPGRTKYSYESLNDVAEAIDPALSKYGFSWRHATQQEGDRVTVTCRLSHERGYFEDNSLSAPYDISGQKNAIQSTGSTITYLQRYTLKQAVGTGAGPDDDGQQGVLGPASKDITPQEDPLISADDIAFIETMLKRTNLSLDTFLKKFGVGGIAHLRVSEYKRALEMLAQREKLMEDRAVAGKRLDDP